MNINSRFLSIKNFSTHRTQNSFFFHSFDQSLFDMWIDRDSNETSSMVACDFVIISGMRSLGGGRRRNQWNIDFKFNFSLSQKNNNLEARDVEKVIKLIHLNWEHELMINDLVVIINDFSRCLKTCLAAKLNWSMCLKILVIPFFVLLSPFFSIIFFSKTLLHTIKKNWWRCCLEEMFEWVNRKIYFIFF